MKEEKEKRPIFTLIKKNGEKEMKMEKHHLTLSRRKNRACVNGVPANDSFTLERTSGMAFSIARHRI